MRTVTTLIFHLFFFMSFLWWTITNWTNPIMMENYNSSLIGWILFLMLLQMIGFMICRVGVYDFGVWFVILSYIFMFGLLFNDNLELKTRLLWNPVTTYSQENIYHSYIFIIWSLFCFSLFYQLFYSGQYHSKIPKFTKENEQALLNMGIILTTLGGIFKLINDIPIVMKLQSANSYLAYSNAVDSGIADDVANLFLPGLFCIFFSSKSTPRVKKILFWLSLFYLVTIMILTGSRKTQIFSILSLTLGYSYSSGKKLSLRRFLVLTVGALLILNILVIIRDYRFDLSSVGEHVLDGITSLESIKQLAGEIFAETGITALSVTTAFTLVPITLPFQYGMTFLRTLPSFLPIGWLIGDVFNKASATYVLNRILQTPVGASIIGESYWNFGFIGGLMMMSLLGIIAAYFMNIHRIDNSKMSLVIYFSIFSQAIMLVRSGFFDVYRPIVYFVILAFILRRMNK